MPTVNKLIRPWMVKQKPTKQNHQGGNQANRDVYDSSRHRKLRKQFLDKNPYCAECLKRDLLEPATVFDHIIPINQGGDPWDESNKAGLCFRCHQRKRATERADRR